jgi:NAD(P)H-dependent flavin oxidoreductase YrpB (nitropropane dioxygenase family)
MASLPLLPMMVKAVAPLPVLCAGGIADGRGIAGALALGAEGVLLGTRFLATHESPLHPNFKQSIVDSDGHDTVLTEIPDLANQRVWPGAMSRAKRNKFIEHWSGREWGIRQNAAEIAKQVAAARVGGDIDNASLSYGQDAGLIDSIKSVNDVVRDIVAEAEQILRNRLPSLLRES